MIMIQWIVQFIVLTEYIKLIINSVKILKNKGKLNVAIMI